MKLTDNRTGIEIITPDECLRLAREARIGRLGVIEDGAKRSSAGSLLLRVRSRWPNLTKASSMCRVHEEKG